jgi:hypothetical protein
MLRKQSVNIRQMSKNRAEQVGYYRFLENDKVTVSELIQSLSEHCEQQVEGLHVLAVNDTSEINLEAHRGRLKAEGQGVVGNNRDIGFFSASDASTKWRKWLSLGNKFGAIVES